MNLSFEQMLQWTLDLSPQDLLSLSETCKYYVEQIGQNEYFWKLKSILMFKEELPVASFKRACFRHGRLRKTENLTHFPGIRFKQISSNVNHIMAIDFDDQVWCGGLGSLDQFSAVGQYGFPTLCSFFTEKAKKVVNTLTTSFILSTTGVLWFIGKDIRTTMSSAKELTRLWNPGKIIDISATDSTFFAIDDQGIVWGSGRINNQLHNLTKFKLPEKIVKVIASDYCHAFISEANKVTLLQIHQGANRRLPTLTGKVKEIGFAYASTIILYQDERFEICSKDGVVIEKGNGGVFMLIEGIATIIWNALGDIVYSEGVVFYKPQLYWTLLESTISI